MQSQLLFMVPIIESSLLQHLSKLRAESIEDKNSIYGEVLFLHDGETRDMKEAIRQIKQMNRLASKRGMLDGL